MGVFRTAGRPLVLWSFFLRVDDRLLHGQIICSWVPYIRAEYLMVVSDEAASDCLVSEIISACGSCELGVLVKSVSEAVRYLKNEADPSTRFMLVVGELQGRSAPLRGRSGILVHQPRQHTP